MKVVALAGGVGGAKLADGLSRIVSPDDLTIIVNTGDDFDHFGLRICPDLDTVCYTLAGLANPTTGWGLEDESWTVFKNVEKLGGPSWFRLGDRDIATHIERTRRLQNGDSLSDITRAFCDVWGIFSTIFPMSDDYIPTIVITDQGDLPFQEYFVHRRCEPAVKGFRFKGVEHAKPARGVVEAIQQAAVLVICPSNPWVSIDPILTVPGIKEAMMNRFENGTGYIKSIAVSPIIGGKAVKGPVAKMYQELGIESSAISVARHYGSLITGFVFDQIDIKLEDNIREMGLAALCTNTLMKTKQDRERLAREILDFCQKDLSNKTYNRKDITFNGIMGDCSGKTSE